MQEENMRDLLYRSFDDTLSAAEGEALAHALAMDASLRQEKEEMIVLRSHLAQLKQGADPTFAENILQKLPVRVDLGTRIRRLWPAVAAACFLTFAVGLGTIFYAEGSLDAYTLLGVDDDLQPEEVLVLGDY